MYIGIQKLLQSLFPLSSIFCLLQILKKKKNTWEEIVVSIASSEGFLEGWIFVLGCFWCWVFGGGS